MKNILFILMALISLLSIEAFSQVPKDDGTCSQYSQEYFHKAVMASDTIKLYEGLQKSSSCLEMLRLFLVKGNHIDMLRYVLRVTKYEGNSSENYGSSDQLMRAAMENLLANTNEDVKNGTAAKAAKVVKILQENGVKILTGNGRNSYNNQPHPLAYIIQTKDLKTIKLLHENKIDLSGTCEINLESKIDFKKCDGYWCCNPIDLAVDAESKEIYQYLNELGYKTLLEQVFLKKIGDIAKFLKANKLEECSIECNSAKPSSNSIIQFSDSLKERYDDLCKKQLVDKIKKMPKNKITPALQAYIDVDGKIIQNRDWIGIDIEDAPKEGVRVTKVVEGSPAKESGIMIGDIIRNRRNVNEFKEYLKFLNLGIGKKVEFIILRGNGKKEMSILVNIGINQNSIDKITELLKANKLEESIEECGITQPTPSISERPTVGMPKIEFSDDSLKKKYYDLCEKQLFDKVRKLPKNKINSPELASIYYDKYSYIQGKVFQNDGKMILITESGYGGGTAMVQISNPIIGSCMLTESQNKYIPFSGYVKYLGTKTYNSLLGKQTVPNYQLLWCGKLN